jgi:acetoin utilization deacetylase AcuC-like enzyme
LIKLAFSDKYIYELPEGHRFPISKYVLVKEQLLYRAEIEEEQLFDPGLCPEEFILEVHTPGYWEKLKSLNLSPKELRRVGLPLTECSLLRARNSVAGTVASCAEALQKGLGINIGGGTHHAYAGHGEGFCILNDLAVTARYLLNEQGISQVLIIDLDVHQGNGTAAIFQEEPRVFTFSMHGEANYPLHKEMSDKDIALLTGTTDATYLEQLDLAIERLFREVKPDFVLYQAGVDVLATDKLGKLSLSKMGCRQRDQLVLESCRKADVPVVVTMGGGYSLRLADVVDAHTNTFTTALRLYA